MLKEGINRFCMALADSVPGVSGGTVALILGFYDQFIGSIHNMAFGKMKEKVCNDVSGKAGCRLGDRDGNGGGCPVSTL